MGKAKGTPGKISASNTFEDGLNTDMHPMSVPASTLSGAMNMEFVTAEGNQYVLQNIKGSELAASLPVGYIALGVREYKNIAYILAGKFDGDGAFIDGLVGTFPSPEWDKLQIGEKETKDSAAEMVLEYVIEHRLVSVRSGTGYIEATEASGLVPEGSMLTWSQCASNVPVLAKVLADVYIEDGLKANSEVCENGSATHVIGDLEYASLLGPETAATDITGGPYKKSYETVIEKVTRKIEIPLGFGGEFRHSKVIISFNFAGNAVLGSHESTVLFVYGGQMVSLNVPLNFDKTPNSSKRVELVVEAYSEDTKLVGSHISAIPMKAMEDVMNMVAAANTVADFAAIYDMDRLEDKVGTGSAVGLVKSIAYGSFYSQFQHIFLDSDLEDMFAKNYMYFNAATKQAIYDKFAGMFYIENIETMSVSSTNSEEVLMEDNFKPLGNLSATGSGDFITPKLKFTKNRFIDIKVAGSYDGSADIIFTDDKNDIMLINSRFKVGENGKAKLADRVGSGDSNIYSDSTWNKAKLLQDAVGIPTIREIVIDDNGKLLGGGYRYYMKYTTQEGNMSDVFYESPFIPIAHDSYGVSDKEYTSKSITFHLADLLKSYNEVKVFFEFHSGDNGVIIDTYQIDATFSISPSRSCTITHSGLEKTSAVDATAINVSLTPVDKAKTLDVVNDRLIIANTEATYDEHEDSILTDVSSRLVLEAKETVISGDYSIPENVIDYLGYWKGEVYEFGIVYILKRGGVSVVYPLVGIDYDEGDKRNSHGIYRLPSGGDIYVMDRNPNHDEDIEKKPKVSHFHLDTSILRDEEKQRLLDIVDGYFIVRRERVKNAVVQGLLSPVAKVGVSNKSMGYSKKLNDFYADMRTSRSFVSVSKDAERVVAGYEFFDSIGVADPRDILTCTDSAFGSAVVVVEESARVAFNGDTYDIVSDDGATTTTEDKEVVDAHVGAITDFCAGGNVYVPAYVRMRPDPRKEENVLGGLYFGIGNDLDFQVHDDTGAADVLPPQTKYIPQPTQYSELIDSYGALSIAARPYPPDDDSKRVAAFYSGDIETNAANIASMVVGNVGSLHIHGTGGNREAYIYRDVKTGVSKSICDTIYDDCIDRADQRYADADGCCTGKKGHRKDDKKKCKKNKADCKKRVAAYGNSDDGVGGSTTSLIIEAADTTSIGDVTKVMEGVSMMFVQSGINVEAENMFTGKSDRDLSYIRYVSNADITYWSREYDTRAYDSLMYSAVRGEKGKYYCPTASVVANYSSYIGLKFESDYNFDFQNGVRKANDVDGELNMFARLDRISKNWLGNMGNIATLYATPVGKWTNEDILTMLATRNSRPYFAVSDRRHITSGSFDIFRGDGYITKTYKRLSYKAGVSVPGTGQADASLYGTGITYGLKYDSSELPNDMHNHQKDDLGKGLFDMGSIIEIISFTNTNTELRSEERVSAEDSIIGGGDRSFYPKTSAQVLRADLRPDSTAYNHGYTGHMGVLPYFSRADAPVNSLVFPNRVYASAANITQNFYNSFKDLRGFSYRDYGIDLGPITKIVGIEGMLVLIHEDGALGIGIDDRTLMGENTDVYIDSAQVLSPKPMPISDKHGSQHSESIIRTEQSFMGIDYARSIIWMFDGKGLKNVSEFAVKSLINDYKDKITGIPRVYGTFDGVKREAVFTFVSEDEATKAQTTVGALIYSDVLKRWTSERSDGLKFMATSKGGSFSFGVENAAEIWEENINEERCVFRGEQHEYYFEVVVNNTPQAEKVLDNIQLISNKNIPTEIIYTLSGEAADASIEAFGDVAKTRVITQKIKTRGIGSGRIGIMQQNAYYKNSGLFIEVSKEGASTRKLESKKRIRDKYIKIKVTYSGSDAVFIQAMLTKLSISYG